MQTLCPYCKIGLTKQPKRKTKCPHCSKYIYIRTDPDTEQKILVREDQLKDIEDRWNVKSEYDDKLNRLIYMFSAIDIYIQKSKTSTPLQALRYSIIHMQEKAQKDWNFGVYRNMRLNMSELLFLENNKKDCLLVLFEVVFLDFNTCNNVSSRKDDADLLKKYPPFIVDTNTIPFILKTTTKYIYDCNLSIKEVEELYISHNNKIYSSWKLIAISPYDSWKYFKQSLQQK